jgi:hypothetical protein
MPTIGDKNERSTMGMLKKAANGVVALLLCSRTESTLRASKRLWPCWTNFFEHPPNGYRSVYFEHLFAFDAKYSTGPQ